MMVCIDSIWKHITALPNSTIVDFRGTPYQKNMQSIGRVVGFPYFLVYKHFTFIFDIG